MIGILDSGIGGENVAKEVRRLYPMLDILLLKDTKNAPYGTKSREELIEITERNAKVLLDHGAHRVLIGCCTASCVWDSLSDKARKVTIPIIEPTAKLARQYSKTGKIALIATERTVKEGAFARALGKNLTFALPLQSLVALVEEGARDGALSREGASFLDGILEPLAVSGADTLILGCTHFSSLEYEILKRVKKYGIENTVSPTLAAAKVLGNSPVAKLQQRGLTINI